MKKGFNDYFNEEDKEALRILVADFVQKFGHECLRELFHLNRRIRKDLFSTRFPIGMMYHFSLDMKLENEYSKLTQAEIAKIEGLTKPCMHYIQKNHYEAKRKRKAKSKDGTH